MKNYNFKLIYKKGNKKLRIAKTILLSLVFGLIVALIAGYFLGYRVYTVLGKSSEPDIHYGSIVIDFKVPFKELKVGDYVTWSRGGNVYVTHKIIDINYEKDVIVTSQTDYYAKEGETVNPDAPISYKQVYGKVVGTIPYIGLILLSLKNLILVSNQINILGILTIMLVFTTYYLFKKLLYNETYTLKGDYKWKK